MAGAKQIPESHRAAVKKKLKAGASPDDALGWAKAQGITVSRATVAVWAREVEAERAALRGKAAEPAAPPPPGASVAPADALAELRAQLAELCARLAALEERTARPAAPVAIPSMSALQAATAAVQVLTTLAQDPEIDPKVRVQAVGALPELVKMLLDLQEPADEDAGLETV